MRLLSKKLLMVIADGVDQLECEQLRRGFEGEGSHVLYTTPTEYAAVETVAGNHRGKDLIVDIPFDAISFERFDGLIIPDGLLSTTLFSETQEVIELVQQFHERSLPIFASGRAVEVLYRSRVLSQCVLVREGEPISTFINQAIDVLLDSVRQPHYARV